MGFIDRHKRFLLAGTTSLVAYLVVDAYRTIKRNDLEQAAQEQERARILAESQRYKIGVDPDAVVHVAHLRPNDHYVRGTRPAPELPPDVPWLEEIVVGETKEYRGSGLLKHEYQVVEPVSSSKN